MKIRIIVIKGESRYQALREFADAFATGLEKANCVVEHIDLLERFDKSRLDKPIDAVVSFNGVGYDIVRKITDAPFFCYLVDHPSCKYLDFAHYSQNDYVLCVDRNHVKYINTYYEHIGGAFFLPHGGIRATDIIPYKDRTIKVLFSGSYYSSESVLEQIQKVLQPFEQKIAYVLISKMQSENITLEKAMLEFLQENQIDYGNEEFTELCFQYQYTINYLRAFYREELIRSVASAGIQVDVLGDGWDKLPGIDGGQIVIHGTADYQESLSILSNSKIVLNSMPWFKDGSHERIFSAMLNRTLCITDASKYLKEQFVDGESLVYYDLEQPRHIIDSITYYLENESEAECIVENAVRIAKENYTWEKRAEEFLCILQAENIIHF